MDSFFVEVERLDDPSLVGLPVAVGGVGPRGVIASASYEAREFGVRSAQPTSSAMRLCPGLKVVPPSHRKYGERSIEVFDVFRSFTPLVEGLSVDEAFLDVSGLTRHHDSPVAVGEVVRAEVRARTGLPCSVGIAATKFIAKLASELAKPDGLLHVPAETQLEFLRELPADALWGVGPATLAGLERIGVKTIGDIAELPLASLVEKAGQAVGQRLMDLANGIDPRPVEPDTSAKSLSVEQTYDTDLVGRAVVETSLLSHAQRLSTRLRRAGLKARSVGIKVRYSDFTTVTRTTTGASPVFSAHDLYQVSRSLLDGVDTSRPVRLLGLSGSLLEPADVPRQLELGHSQDRSDLDEAIAQVRDRFGEGAVAPARLARAGDEDQLDAGDD